MSKSESKGSFTRWQANAITQLTYAANLVLTLAVATLGFQTSLLFNDKFCPDTWQRRLFAASLATIVISIAFGLCLVLNRLLDFRATKEAARLREDGADDSEVEPYRVLYRKYGKRTWVLFWWQLGLFGGGITLAVAAVAWVTWHKLM